MTSRTKREGDPYGAAFIPGADDADDEGGDQKVAAKKKESKAKVDSEHGSRYGAVDLGLGTTHDEDMGEFEGADGMDVDAYRGYMAGLGEAYGVAGEGEAYGTMTNPDSEVSQGNRTRYGAQDAPEDREERLMRMRIKRKELTKYEKSLKNTMKLKSIFENTREVVEMKGWSASFLEAEELPERTAQEVLTKYKRLTKLSTDFIEIAKAYGRTAITEYFLNEKRTVKKHKLGGVAGGDKYLVRGILFKLAVDPPMGRSGWIYGGTKENFEYAAKAAGHELKGAINMYKYHVKKIRVPMQALVDFHGYRIVAMPLLPLKKLIYGSKDAGKTIHRSNEEFNKIMEEIAADLHVAGHYICDKEGTPNLLHAAGDIEGHMGEDGRYYLLDLARAFPPESVWDTSHLNRPSQAVFFRMLRPEFLQILKETGQPPLSCDALTNWGQSYKDKHEHNERLRQATRTLVGKVIPDFAKKFASESVESLKAVHVSEELHRNGINVRHTGLVRSLIKGNDASSEQARRTLLVTMCERTLKNLLRREMRMELARHKNTQPSDHESRAMVVDFLNLVTRAHQTNQTYNFWSSEVPFELKLRFGPKSISIEEEYNLFGAVRHDIVNIVKYIIATTGVQLTGACVETLERSGGAGYEFVSVDLGALTVRIKHMSVIDYATAKVLSQEAYEDTGVGGDRLLSLAVKSFDQTLQSDPLNKDCQREANITRLRIEARENEKKKKQANWEQADSSLFLACQKAFEAKDSDNVVNIVKEILGTWKARVKQEECPKEYTKSGGASSSKYIQDLVVFVEAVDTVGRNLTILLCAFLATCKDEHLWEIMHELLYKTTVNDQKSATKTLVAWTQTTKRLEGAALNDKLVRDLISKVEAFEDELLTVALSNFLAALQQPAFWIEACRISYKLEKEVGRKRWAELYESTPWHLTRTNKLGPVTDEEAKQIGNVIKASSPLASLNLHGCRMSDKHIRMIAAACIRLPEETQFETLEYKQKIPILKLRANELTEAQYSRATSQDVVWLFSLLHHNTSVKQIELDSTNLNVLEVTAIAECLKVHPITALTITNCNMGDAELKLLAPALGLLPDLKQLSLSGNTFTDKSGVLLGKLHSIANLDLSKCIGVTDETLNAISAECKGLNSLNLSHCHQVTDNGVSGLAACSGLKTLILEECAKLSDYAIQAIAEGCTSLVEFNIRNCKKVTGVSISHVARKCTKLERLNLCFCDYITDQSIGVLASNCKALQFLNLGHCKRLTDQSVGQIGSNCPMITELNLSVCEKITDESIIKVAKGCPQLQKLNLAVCDQITDASISQISQTCTELKDLVVPCCDKITDNSITLLSRCKNLERLNVYACKKVTDRSISEIAKSCPKLAHLDVFWCAEVSDDVIEELKSNNPTCEVDR